MAGRIPQHFINELVARADIIDVIGARVQLKKAGKEYKACCPFHDEKSPSFTVVPDKQFYYCFGCGAHGTALGFLMEYDHLSFVEAIEDLAARLGMEIPREEDPTATARPSDDLYLVMDRVAEFYRKQLRGSERAKAYLLKRGLTGETASRFGIGYAPDAWDSVLRQFGVNEDEQRKLMQAGLVIERDPKGGAHVGYYDRFRDRIMFPIRDARGRTIGFGGRILDQGEPKYMNSPETELFHKGRELYGLFEARQSARSIPRLLVVEGYMDVVRLHQAGIGYAVATLGTATTADHLNRLFRVCSEVIFCFDGDRAGRGAAWRALENSLSQLRQGRQIRFLFLPEGHDPDSLVGNEGREAFEARFGVTLTLSEYLLQELRARADLRSVDGRAQAAELAKPLLNRISAGVYRELLITEVAKLIGLPTERLESSLMMDPGPRQEPVRERSSRETHEAKHPESPPTVNQPRNKLVRKVIHQLVHFPAAAQLLTLPAALEDLHLAGIPLLIELITELQENPAASTGALLERWRERPHYEDLSKLATQGCLVPDVQGAAKEISDALQKMVREEQARRAYEQIVGQGMPASLDGPKKD